MKKIKILSFLMLLAGISVSNVALADHGHGGWHGGGHVGFGLYLGAPYIYPYYPYYPPYPYGYYPPTVVVPAQQQVYIEQGNHPARELPMSQENNYWYHCDKPEGYYPYIKECPGGWQKVSPTPPPQQ